mmetsp:Transcript_5415/g.13658  ORF Transcript_5415/g.13658 Transcript_5415/m.13658 type:complete len:120 (+) Transcript_5415:3-362(+)
MTDSSQEVDFPFFGFGELPNLAEVRFANWVTGPDGLFGVRTLLLLTCFPFDPSSFFLVLCLIMFFYNNMACLRQNTHKIFGSTSLTNQFTNSQQHNNHSYHQTTNNNNNNSSTVLGKAL